MPKITFMGAGSTVFARNVLGDCMCTEALRDSELALYDIDPVRLAESRDILTAMNETKGGHARISAYLGAENRKEALISSSTPFRSAATTPAPSRTLRSRSSSACARPSATRWASAGSCAHCGRSPS